MDSLPGLLGRAPAIVRLREQVRQVLERTSRAGRVPPILLEGETGTGKNLVAASIHRSGPRRDRPFVDVNCAAIPESLLEAELFGFERGAFTDARQARAGLFQCAHGGTLFLDEIALLPEALQAKLLKAIEERSVRRLGRTRSEPVDVSIVAATNEDLGAAVTARRFRQDLYHRLAVVTLRLPALHDRAEDIPLLAEHFLERTCKDYGLAPKTLTPAAHAALRAYRWPGNVRELANAMERVALLIEDARISAEALALPMADGGSQAMPAPPADASLPDRVEALEREELLRALREARGNVVQAAAHLGITRGTIRYRMEKYGLERARHRTRLRRRTRAPAASPAIPSAPAAPARWETTLVALLAAMTPADFGRDLDLVVAKVESFGGRVEEASPSRIVAAFGVRPVEDAARRAALAAMAIGNALLREPAAARVDTVIAIHADHCPVAAINGRIQIDGDARRRAMTVLAELGSAAEPGAIVVSETAQSVLGRRFDLAEPRGGVTRGRRLLGYQPQRFGVGAEPDPFIGREHELDVLRTRWREAAQGRGQIVALVGEPGIGKSRLVHEFHRVLADEPWISLAGHGESYGAGVSYLPIIDLLKTFFGVDDRKDLAAIGERVSARLGTLDPALASDVSPLLDLLGAPVADTDWHALAPEQRRRRTLDALTRFVLCLSRKNPVRLVIEDLHWIDTETQAFLDQLVLSLPAARLLAVVTYRPEYAHSWAGQSSYHQLRLDPLSTTTVEAIARSILGNDGALQPLVRLLVERTEGNPFFLEETIRTLIETGELVGERGTYRPARPLHALEVPPTVRAVLAARIDRLPADEKEVLQAAAVVGKDVPLSLLRAIVDVSEPELRRMLRNLQATELLLVSRLLPDAEYTFKHALTHEVAYAALRPDRQRALHARMVEALEAVHADRLMEHVERLAHHALSAALWPKALVYCRQAALKASARSALQEARGWFEHALQVLDHLPEGQARLEQAFELRLELRVVVNQLGEIGGSLQHLREAEVIADRLNDDWRRGRVDAYMANIHPLLGDLDEAVVRGTRAVAIARVLNDLRLRTLATTGLVQAHYYRGDYERAIELATDNLAALPAAWVAERQATSVAPGSVYDRSWLVMSLAQLGRFAEATEHEAEMIRLAEAMQHLFTIGLAHRAAGTRHLLQGDWETGRVPIERAILVLRTGSITLLLSDVLAASALILAQLGDASAALTRLSEAEQVLERETAMGIVGNRWVYLSLGRAYLLLHRLDEARSLAERVIESSPSQPGFGAHALHLLGDIATHPERFDADSGEVHYERSMALAEPRGMRPLVAQVHLGLGKLHARAGRRQQAEEHLATAATMFRDMRMWFWLDAAQAAARGG